MVDKLEKLISACPQNLWLELSPKDRQIARQQIHSCSNDVARRRAYINSLCLNAFFGWLQNEPDLQDEAPMPWPGRSELAAIWELLNGTAIEFGQTRLLLVPSETVDPDQMSVLQEWVDIPSWTADYYLAVQVNLDEEEQECWMRVWGFATRQTLENGEYDSVRRAYILNREDLIEDLNVLWVARKVCPEQKIAAKPLPALSSERAEKLLEQLGQPTAYSPRLEQEFEEWATLLENNIWREELYQRRLKAKEFANAYSLPELPHLSQWFDLNSNSVMKAMRLAGWQLYQDVFSSADAAAFALRFVGDNFRSDERSPTVSWVKPIRWEGEEVSSQPAIALAIHLMRNSDGTISILPQVRPIGKVERQLCLPEGLQLIILDESEETFDRVKAGRASNLIQLDGWLSDSPGGQFSVKIVCGQISIVENFAI